ncbi:MAG TPA: C4-type zinc ribbon domain-containing protein [Acidimicrobiales bacterium]|jgi:predicted  nucleic acid-binding Zn-ribbon protein|nr:C4-type zinc ribbon domain-containing protein [Acidimicrobiales bacterium]
MSRWDTLLTVQELDTHADQLVHRSQHLPARAALVEIEGRLAKVDADIAEVDSRLGDLSRSQGRLEDEIASLRMRAQQADKQLYSGTTNNPRELQALQDDIASIQRRIAKIEDDELDVMEATEPVDAEKAVLLARRQRQDDQAQGLRAELAEAEVEIEAELAGVREQRDIAAKAVPDELWPEYDRLRASLGGIAIARLAGTTCQGCHLGLSAVEVDRIRKLSVDELVHCEECGRLLVRE